MSSVTFSTTVGGDGSTVTDDNNATTGLRDGGWKTRFVPCFTQQVAVANYVVNTALTVLGGATTNSTSTTSLVIGTGSKSLTLSESGKGYIVGQYVVIASTASPSNNMVGQITSFSGTSLVVNVTTINGSGTISAWSISVTSAGSYLSLTGGTMTGLLTTKELALTKTAPSISAGVLTLDCSLANTFAVSLNAAITSFTVSNIPTTGSYYEFNLEFTADGTARSVTWTFSSVAVKWPGGTAPTLTSTSGKKDTFVFYTYDAGTTWLGFVAGQNL